MHELSENEDIMSQPPRQYAPTPHWPYCEQHGVSFGHGFSGSQVGILPARALMEKVAASAAATLNVCRMLLILYLRGINVKLESKAPFCFQQTPRNRFCRLCHAQSLVRPLFQWSPSECVPAFQNERRLKSRNYNKIKYRKERLASRMSSSH